ncbi:MAG: tyrosine--tRNA ligase [Gemmatimonadota bacterium]
MFPKVDEQIARITDGVAEVIPEQALRAKLQTSLDRGEPLVVKQGFDPTRPDLHLGHAVSIDRLRVFQELGHQVVFLIGNFTALVGDPSGRDETRPALSPQEIELNLKTYTEQVGKILDPGRTVFRRNSEWLSPMTLPDVLKLTSQYTVARMLERDDFSRRYADGRPITLAEFLYPMMQAFDSVQLQADVELGGTDQKFNLLLGRTFQEKAGQDPQVCITVPILRGTDGSRKMSKSYDNYVGLSMEPSEMYGRTMSIPDTLLEEWIRLASGASREERVRRVDESATDPLSAKRWLAAAIVGRYHGLEAAHAAEDGFDRMHRDRAAPEELAEYELATDPNGKLGIAHALLRSGLTDSTSDAHRMIKQGAVRVDGEVVSDGNMYLEPGTYVLQRGKRRYARILVGGKS